MILIRGLMVMIIGVVRCAAQDAAAMPECREGDSNCFVTVGHRLFGDKEYAHAIDMFTKAGDNPRAIDAIGFAYETGQGKPKDLSMAFTLYSKAAEKGYEASQFHLGNCYARGVGVAADETEAYKLQEGSRSGPCLIVVQHRAQAVRGHWRG